MKYTLHNLASGQPVEIQVFDRGIRAFNGHEYYTTRYLVPGRKRAIISRVDRDVADLAADTSAFRFSEDIAVLETRAGLTF